MPGSTHQSTPRALGYRMPAEWEPHEATWLVWPHNPEDWPGKFAAIPWLYAEIVRLLAARERVQLIVEDAAAEQRVRGMLRRAGVALDRVDLHPWPTDRGWTRDSGPIFIRKDGIKKDGAGRNGSSKDGDRGLEGTLGLTWWQFNGWAKYDDWKLDCQLPGRIAEVLSFPQWQPTVELADGSEGRIILEGGSIDVNGKGLLLTTEECLLSEVQQRNPGLGREQLEQVFRDYLGIDHVIWLGRGIVGDDTHGHVDDIARFVGPETIVAAVEPDTGDPNHAPLKKNLQRLKAARTPEGKQFTVVELPMPRPVVFRGQRLPASYANFYIANGLVLVPTFHDPDDRVALNLLAELFPDREVVGIHSVDLVWGLGTLHCMTQQQPAAQPADEAPSAGAPAELPSRS
jgi:agmatine deiminase